MSNLEELNLNLNNLLKLEGGKRKKASKKSSKRHSKKASKKSSKHRGGCCDQAGGKRKKVSKKSSKKASKKTSKRHSKKHPATFFYHPPYMGGFGRALFGGGP